MPETNYDIGIRVGSTSDDGAIQRFEQSLNKVLEDSGRLSESLKALTNSFGTQEKGAETAGKKTQEAGDKVQDAGKKAKEAGGFFRGLGDDLLKTLAGFFALEKIGEFIKDTFSEAVNAQREMVGFTSAIQMLTGATAEDAQKAYEWVEAWSISEGISKTKAIPAMEKLMAATGDAAASQTLLKDALLVSRKAHTDLDTVVSGLTRGLINGQMRGTDPFVVAMKSLMKQGHSVAESFEILVVKAKGVETSQETVARKLDRAKVSWEETKEKLGETALVIFDHVSPAFEFLGKVIGALMGSIGLLGTSFGTVYLQAESLVKAVGQLGKGDLKGAQTTMNAAALAIKDSWKDALSDVKEKVDEYGRLWDRAGAKAKAAELDKGMSTKDALAKVIGDMDAAEKAAEARMKAEGKAAQDLAKAYVEVAKARADEAKGELGRAKDPQAMDASLQKAIKARQDLLKEELAMVQKERDAEVEAAKKLGASTLDIEKRYALQEDKLRHDAALDVEALEREKAKSAEDRAKQIHEAQLRIDKEKDKEAKKEVERVKSLDKWLKQDLKKMTAAELWEFQQESMKRIMIEARTAEEVKAISRGIAAAKKQMAWAAAQETLASLAAVVDGNSTAGRAILAAEAVVNFARAMQASYVAANESAKDTPGPYWVKIAAWAAMLATGIGAAMAIKNLVAPDTDQTQGKGFDDPRNDRLAELGGRRWAMDLVDRIGYGFGGGLNEFMPRLSSVSHVTHGPVRKTVVNASINTLTGAQGEWAVESLARMVDGAAPKAFSNRLGTRRTSKGSSRRVKP
jgi:hypothetical protein